MKKIGLLLLAMVLALGAVGAAFAMWDKVLYVEGTVDTGEVNAIFVKQASNDDGAQLDPSVSGTWFYDNVALTLDWDGTRYDKHVANTVCVIAPDEQTITVTLTNAYPSYWGSVAFYAQNNGTIPVIVNSMDLIKDGDWDLDNDGNDDVFVGYNSAPGILDEGYQLDPGENAIGAVWIHVEQTDTTFPVENAQYVFHLQIQLVQWNEYPYP